MTDIITPDHAVRTLPLAPGGEVDIFLASNTIRLRGTDGDQVIVRSHDGEALEGAVTIEDADGSVRIRDGEARAFRLGPIVVGSGRSLDLDVHVPRSARVSVRTVSGDIQAVGIGGPSRWTTASGTLLLGLDGGPVSIESMSGDVTVRASVALDVAARSVSGDLRIVAPTLTALTASTTSGDVEVDAALADGGTHTVSSVSGDVALVTDTDVRVETQSVTGDIRAVVPHRTEGGRGRRTLIVGEGRARITVGTLSGDVTLRGARPVAAAPADRDDGTEAVPAVRDGARATPAPPVPAPATPPPGPVEPSLVVAEAEAAANLIRPGDTVPPPAPAVPAGPAPANDPVDTLRLDILRALERGELDVDTASRRLAALDDGAANAAAGWS